MPRSRIPAPLLVPILFVAVAGAAPGHRPAAGDAGPTPTPPARLALDATPTAEAVDLVLDPERSDYHGEARVTLAVHTPVRELRFHARALTIDAATLRGDGGDVRVSGVERVGGDQARVLLGAPLAPGAYTLALRFHNDYDTHAVALYRVQTGGHSYLFTQFEDTEAREAFPCWDEPGFKIPWTLTLEVPAADLAVSNTPVARVTRAGAMQRVAFAATPPLPSYLVAIAVGPFDVVPIHGLDVPGRVLTVRGSGRLGAEAARVTPPILRGLERYFGRRYPFAKLDLIGAPEFLYGAMENAGAVVFAERALLLDPRGASPAQHHSMESTLTHELAHMWFGDLVTMRWWNDLWLNESFANWMQTKVDAEVFPDEHEAVQSVVGGQRAFTIDSRPSTKEIRFPVSGATSLGQTANELTYDKGEAVLRMFEGWMGPDTFRRGVLQYLDAHAWGNAEGHDLFAALGAASGEDVDGAMASFLDQPGVPIVTVAPLGAGRIRLAQRQFLTVRAEGEETALRLWRIPVQLRYPGPHGVTTKRVWLTGRDTVVDLGGSRPPEWIEPNAGGSGYYRWSVPERMVDALVASHATLEPAERVDAIACLTAALEAGLVPGDRYLEWMARLADDPSPEVTREAVITLNEVRVPLATPRSSTALAAYVQRTLAPALARFGAEPRAGESPDVGEMRPGLLRLLAETGDSRVLDEVTRLDRAYRRDPASIPPSMVETAVLGGAIHGGPDEWEDDRRRFESATVPSDRLLFLNALGAFHDPALRERALDYCLHATLRPQETTTIPTAMAENPLDGIGRTSGRVYSDAVARWALDHFDALAARMPPNFSARILGLEAGCSTDRLTAIRDFLQQPAHAMIGGRESLRRLSDATRECAGLHDRESGRVEAWLATHVPRPWAGTRG